MSETNDKFNEKFNVFQTFLSGELV